MNRSLAIALLAIASVIAWNTWDLRNQVAQLNLPPSPMTQELNTDVSASKNGLTLTTTATTARILSPIETIAAWTTRHAEAVEGLVTTLEGRGYEVQTE